MAQHQKVTRAAPALLAGALLLVAGAAFAQSAAINRAINEQAGAEAAAAQSQQRINQLDTEAQNMVGRYRSALAEAESYRRYNEHLAAQLESQNAEVASMETQLAEIENTNREIYPLMQRMLETLEKFVELDLPFNLGERRDRVGKLKDAMGRADVTTTEKYRRLLEAYTIEMEYGRTVESYQEQLGSGADLRTVEVLRIGRVALLYQTLGGEETGYWDQTQKVWVVDNSYRDAVVRGLKIAKKQTAPDLLIAPVAAAAGGA